jgi:hypothetical protein
MKLEPPRGTWKHVAVMPKTVDPPGEPEVPPPPDPDDPQTEWPETAYLLSGWVQQRGASIDSAVLAYLSMFAFNQDRIGRLQTELAALLAPGQPPAELDVLVATHARRWVIQSGRETLEQVNTALQKGLRA